jgi:hypothetical protein
MTTKFYSVICTKKILLSLALIFMVTGIMSSTAHAQSVESEDRSQQLKPLRSDVGINGLTANFKFLNDFTYEGKGSLESDSNTELEFKFRNVRTMTSRSAVGYQILTSFFAGDSDFGIGSWGLGPVLRGYIVESDQWQPYLQADALFGNNMALGDLADTKTGGNGFRVRLALRSGLAYRLSNNYGLFLEAGREWESSRLFKADAKAWQINLGIDLYLFN